MAIQKLFTSRANGTQGSTYVGERGHLFYDESTGLLRLSDGATPGGLPVLIASTTANLGDLYVTGPTISTVNPNEDLNLDSNGTGNVNIVGSLRILTSAGFYATTPVLSASQAGNVTVNGNLITNGSSYFTGVTVFNGTTIRNGTTVSNGNVTWNGTTVTNGTATNNGNTAFNGNILITGNTAFVGNVSHLGYTSFVGDVAHVGNIVITGETINNGLSIFNGNLTIAGNAALVGNTTVSGTTLVTGNTTVTGNTLVTGNTNVIGSTYLTGNSYVTGNTFVTGTTTVTGNTTVTGQVTTITGNTYLTGNSFVTGATTVTGNITITGNSVQTGPATFIVTMNSSNQGAVEITGNTLGLSQPPQNSGVMLHTTGPDGDATSGRAYFDSNGNYTVIAGRRFNGTIANPTQVLAGQDIVRWGGTPYATGGWPTIGPARMTYTAGENQTATNQGGYITFHTTANGTVTTSQILTAVIDPAYGVTSPIGFVTAGNVSAGNVIATTYYGNIVGTSSTLSGNLTAGNVIATTHYGNIVGTTATLTGNITAANVNATVHGNVIGVASSVATNTTSFATSFLTGQVNIPSQVIAKNTTSVDVTVTVTGLTTSHKVIVTPAADLNSGVILTAAYPTTANTLGVQLQNTNPGGITTTAFNLTYMAWI